MSPETPTMGRRGFLGAVGALAAASTANVATIAANPATVAKSGIDWDQWELEIGCACARVTFCDDEIAVADRAFKRWEARNAWPREAEYALYEEGVAEQRLQAAQGAHCVRYQNALRQCGRGALKSARNEEFRKYQAVCQRVAEIPVRTLSDLKEKSRLARFEYAGGPIRLALSSDLQNI